MGYIKDGKINGKDRGRQVTKDELKEWSKIVMDTEGNIEYIVINFDIIKLEQSALAIARGLRNINFVTDYAVVIFARTVTSFIRIPLYYLKDPITKEIDVNEFMKDYKKYYKLLTKMTFPKVAKRGKTSWANRKVVVPDEYINPDEYKDLWEPIEG